MTLKQTMEMLRLERDMAQLERAIQNPCLACSGQGTPEHMAALERIAQKRMRWEELKKSE